MTDVVAPHSGSDTVSEPAKRSREDDDEKMDESAHVVNGAHVQSRTKAELLEEASAAVPKRPKLDLNADAELKKRSKRMFGVLLGTLTEFKQASSQKSEKDIRREQIMQKTQERMQREREELAAKVQKEQEERRRQIQEERQRLEKERAIYTRNTLQAQHEFLSRYIKTKSSPSIYYLPAKHNDATTALLEESRQQSAAALQTIAESSAAADAAASAADDVAMIGVVDASVPSGVGTPSRVEDPMATEEVESAQIRRGRGEDTPDRMDEDGKGDEGERPGTSKDEDEVHW